MRCACGTCREMITLLFDELIPGWYAQAKAANTEATFPSYNEWVRDMFKRVANTPEREFKIEPKSTFALTNEPSEMPRTPDDPKRKP